MAISLHDLFRYSDNCRALLRETLVANSEAFDKRFRTGTRFDTVRMLLAHSVGAEERWIERRLGGRSITDYEDRAAASIEDLYADWDAIRSRTKAYMDGLTAEDYGRSIYVELGSPGAGWEWSGNLTIEQILFHIVNHEVHHRAQISMALQQLEVDPPNFDYVILKA